MDPSVAKDLEGLTYGPPTEPGGFFPISDLKHEIVVGDAKIAVEKYNELNNRNLHFVSVVSGKRRVASGPVYDMVIAATEGSNAARPRNYRVQVWLRDRANNDCVISSFEQI